MKICVCLHRTTRQRWVSAPHYHHGRSSLVPPIDGTRNKTEPLLSRTLVGKTRHKHLKSDGLEQGQSRPPLHTFGSWTSLEELQTRSTQARPCTWWVLMPSLIPLWGLWRPPGASWSPGWVFTLENLCNGQALSLLFGLIWASQRSGRW